MSFFFIKYIFRMNDDIFSHNFDSLWHIMCLYRHHCSCPTLKIHSPQSTHPPSSTTTTAPWSSTTKSMFHSDCGTQPYVFYKFTYIWIIELVIIDDISTPLWKFLFCSTNMKNRFVLDQQIKQTWKTNNFELNSIKTKMKRWYHHMCVGSRRLWANETVGLPGNTRLSHLFLTHECRIIVQRETQVYVHCFFFCIVVVFLACNTTVHSHASDIMMKNLF